MRTINQYQCECCGTLYKDASTCKACEKQHRTPTKILKADHRAMGVCAAYPLSVQLEFDDGKVVTYERKSGIK